jgi:MoxR-like ATPase
LREDGRGGRAFEFQPGPIFGHLVLADEINRATPKTQSALLEAMQESSVTVAGVSHPLPAPFAVLATQNPIELEGTYPLPEAQLDRFMLKLLVPSYSLDEMTLILDRTTGARPAPPSPIRAHQELLGFRELVRRVPAARPVQEALARLTLATNPQHPEAPPVTRQFVRYGASPRGAQALMFCGKFRALAQGRYHLAHEDFLAWAKPVLRHRLILNYEAEAAGMTPDQILNEILAKTAQGG